MAGRNWTPQLSLAGVSPETMFATLQTCMQLLQGSENAPGRTEVPQTPPVIPHRSPAPRDTAGSGFLTGSRNLQSQFSFGGNSLRGMNGRLNDHTSMRRLRNTVDSTRSQASRRPPPSPIIKPLECICLGYPTDRETPGSYYLEQLVRQGLGNTVIDFDTMASAPQVEESIRDAFPKLLNMSFRMMKAMHGGGPRRPLVLIDGKNPMPKIQHVFYLKLKKIYIVPAQQIFSEEDDSDSSTENESASTLHGEQSVTVERIDENLTGAYDDDANRMRNEMNARFDINDYESPGDVEDSIEIFFEEAGSDSDSPEAKLKRFQASMRVNTMQNIEVKREDLLETTITELTKSSFNPTHSPKVHFVGEAGIDTGGLRREWMYDVEQQILHATVYGGKSIFEGNRNNKLPASDMLLHRKSVFLAVGRFILLNCIHGNLGMRGIGKSAISYFLQVEAEDLKGLLLYDEDLSIEASTAIETIRKFDAGQAGQKERDELEKIAEAAGCGGVTSYTVDALEAMEMIKLHDIIDKRRRQLDAIKGVLEKSGLLQFLRNNLDCLPLVFPPEDVGRINVDQLHQKIRVKKDSAFPETANRVVGWMKSFVEEIQDDQNKLSQLVRAWTGTGDMPNHSDNLEIYVDQQFMFHICFSELEVGPAINPIYFRSRLEESMCKNTGFLHV